MTDVVPDDLGGVFNLANYGSDTIVLQSVVVAFMPPGVSQVNISPDPPVVVFPEGDFRSIFVDCFDADSNLVTAVGVQLTLTVQCDSGPTSTVTITF